VVRVAQVVDPLYTVVAKFPKRLLPSRTAEAASRGRRLPDMPWTEAERFLTPDRVVVLPLGAAAKEHGPHLLLRNDEILAEYYARRVLEARPVALLPTLTYGFYPAFLEYPGSVSLSLLTQRDAVAEICRSLARYGPRRFYVLNTGVSTLRPLKATAELLAREGILMRYTDVLKVGAQAERAVREQKFGTHADEIETSMILYMEPSAVRMDKAAEGGSADRPGPLTRDPNNPQGVFSASGVFGDARLATREKGERIVEAAVLDILAEIDALAGEAVPPGTPASPLETAR
jgi:creatinine amidohydrolase